MSFDPLVPRDVDRPSPVPLDADVTAGPVAVELDDAKIFAAPTDVADLERWRAQLVAWRDGARRRHGSTPRYDDAAASWASRCFAVAQVWLWDELFFDARAQRFTPERFVDDARERFGGLDGVVLWHAYPVIGVDARNQWDFYRVPGLAEAAAWLRAAGVAVFVDYNPWDVGTRRDDDDDVCLARTVRELGADGVFLDTLRTADRGLVAALDEARPGVGLEGESRLATARIADHTLSWAQWFADSDVPGVLRARWFERRHMQHHVRRWHRDHAAELRSAWLNGVGVMVWEVVFGSWVGWNERDSATLRRMLPVQRTMHRWLTEGRWTPLAVLEGPLAGSAFVLDGVTLLVLANSGEEDVVHIPSGRSWTSLHGRSGDGSHVRVPAQGVAAVLVPDDGVPLPAGVEQLRLTLADEPHVPDASFPHRRARRLEAPAWPGGTAGAEVLRTARTDVVAVPAGQHVLTVRFRARETGMYEGAPYVDEWKPLPPRLHDLRTLERVADVRRPVDVAVTEVSEAQFALFLEATGEASGERAHGRSSERPAGGMTFAQARACAAWLGGRLPTEDEWQLAAAQPSFRRRTPCVWNWTESEHSDGRTRFVMLKGGSEHRAEGSDWYFDGGVQVPELSAKYLLPGLGVDASPALGFRVCWGGAGRARSRAAASSTCRRCSPVP